MVDSTAKASGELFNESISDDAFGIRNSLFGGIQLGVGLGSGANGADFEICGNQGLRGVSFQLVGTYGFRRGEVDLGIGLCPSKERL